MPFDPRLEMLRLAGIACGNDCACAREHAGTMTFRQLATMGAMVAKKSPAHEAAASQLIQDAAVKMPLDSEEKEMFDRMFTGTPGVILSALFDALGRSMSRGGPRQPAGDSSAARRHYESAPA